MVPRIAANSYTLECKSDSIELFSGLPPHGECAPGENATGERASATGESVSSGRLPGEAPPREAAFSVEGLGVAILLVFQGAIFFAIGFIVAKWTH